MLKKQKTCERNERLVTRDRPWNPNIVLMLKVGVCGGFTTFSTFAFETADLLKCGNIQTAAAYMILSAVFGVLAVFAAQLLV